MKNLIDGEPATAWCEGKKGFGKGEWVKFLISPHRLAYPYCRFYGIALTQGYLKGEETFSKNGKLKKVRFSHCQDNQLVTEAVFSNAETRPEFAVQVFGASMEALGDVRGSDRKEDLCLQMTIEEVFPSMESEDTCISEIAFIVDCA